MAFLIEIEAMSLISGMFAYMHYTNVDVRVLKMEAMESKQNVYNEKPFLFQKKNSNPKNPGVHLNNLSVMN